MSFPSRPPMGMPGMMSQGYGFTPVGMMPMGMGVMPGSMMRPTLSTSASAPSTTTTTTKTSKKLVPQEIPKDAKEDKPPVTTAFVGNISERAPDAMVRQMLQRCGNVLSWKRVQGASGKLQAFGFCEYEDPEATLRCIRLLNEWQIADKTLVVKVDPKTKTLLEDYKKKKRAREGNSDARNGDKDKDDDDSRDGSFGDEELDEFTKREDRVAKAGLDAIMREYSKDLDKEPSLAEPTAEEKKEKRKEQRKEKKDEVKDAGLDDMELEEEKKDLINREIQSFRDAHKGEEEKEAERNRERERRRREEERERERRERERERERREKEREIERKRERERTRSRSRSRSRDRYIERERERHDRERERELEDEEEAYERRKLEKKLREKEAAYQERLKNWEARERKKTREFDKEREKEEERKNEEAREARRLKEFLEDYDDERDDPKYYKGSALQRRLKEREKEMEADARDRQREKEEIDEIRRRLLEEGHPNLEEQMARIERERDEHLMPRLHNAETPVRDTPSPQPELEPPAPPGPEPPHPAAHAPLPEPDKKMVPLQPADPLPADLPPEIRQLPANSISSHSSPESDGAEPLQEAGGYSEDSSSLPFIGPATREDQQKARMGFSAIKLGRSSDSPTDSSSSSKNKRKKLTVGDVFNQDDDESADGSKKRRLEPLVYSQEEQAAVSAKSGSQSDISRPTTAEEKRKCIKMLIEKIPTAKEELFAYQLDWKMVDTTLMDRRIKPWVNKKIVEYIGEEEPTLTDFICQKVMLHSPPQVILNDVAMVLDEEAEVFVVKMWRLLIYETEAKKAGLVK